MSLRLLWAPTTTRPSSYGAARAEPSLLELCRVATELDEVRAIREAEAWHGPSIIIAYAPCIRSALPLRSSKNHGLKAKGGMGKSQAEEKGGAAMLITSWRVPGRRVRLLALVALQPRPHRGRQEPVLSRLKGAQLGELPRLDFVFVRRDSA